MPFPITENKTVAPDSITDTLFALPGQRACGTVARHLLAAKPPAVAGGALSAASTAPGVLASPTKKRSRQRSSAPNQAPSRPRLEFFAWKGDENKENVDPCTGRTSSPFSCSPFASSFAATRAGTSSSTETAYRPLSPSRKKRMLQREKSSSSSRSMSRGCGRGGKRVGGGGSGGGAAGAGDGMSCSSSLREPLRVLWTSEGNEGNARNASAPFCCNALRAMR